jgi:transketolase
VVRPAGGNETALAWRFAVEQTATPTVMALSRQGLPSWKPSGVPDDAVSRGAYTLRHSYKDAPDVILIGTGSEVHVCTRAAELLEADGVAARVVSMPCMDRFAAQDEAYRDEVLPPDVRARVAVEAAATFGWHRWVGDAGTVIGMEGFGASAPQPALYEHFGFTPERVAKAAKEALEGVGARA